MNVSELFNLTQWITREIGGAQIPHKYQVLQKILQQNLQTNLQKLPFETQKDDLIKTLKSVPLDQLTREQIAFLDSLGIANTVGEEGSDQIEDILYKNVIDVATSVKKLQQIHQKLSEGISKSNQIKAGLTGCVLEEEYEAENEILMRVSFTGHALMENVTDFKSWGNIWFDIGRGIAMAHDLSPDDIKIVGATKGSIIMELAVVASVATTTSGIILAALKVAEKVLDILNMAEELKSKKLKNTKLAEDLQKEAENEKNDGIKEITNNITEKLGIKNNGKGDKIKALNTAVKNLVNFIEKGGVIDFVVPEEEEIEEGEEDQHEDLRVAFNEIRKLEKKIELLEHKKL